MLFSFIEQREEIERRQKADKQKLKQFKESVEGKVEQFFSDQYNSDMKFDPMEKIYRTIM